MAIPEWVRQLPDNEQKQLQYVMNLPLKDMLANEYAKVNLGVATVTRRGKMIVFEGSPTGQHSIDYAESDARRIIDHALGYLTYTLSAQRNTKD
jgi:hypothetical protein